MKKQEIIIYLLLIMGLFIVILGLKIGWAIYAYDDWRCTFSECRIIK